MWNVLPNLHVDFPERHDTLRIYLVEQMLIKCRNLRMIDLSYKNVKPNRAIETKLNSFWTS